MNLAKLFETQRLLDEHILDEHPELKGQNNLDWKILALQVELGECANEWRGFKKWSNNQQPSKIIHTTEGTTTEGATTENAVFYQCGDECGKRFYKGDDRLNDLFGKNDEDCPACEVGLLDAFRKKNPLLEEYVDCLHFILSIGLELYLDTDDWIFESITYHSIITQYIALNETAAELYRNPFANKFLDLVETFIGLGEMLGFTWEQIDQAYYDKNAINHERQATGY